MGAMDVGVWDFGCHGCWGLGVRAGLGQCGARHRCSVGPPPRGPIVRPAGAACVEHAVATDDVMTSRLGTREGLQRYRGGMRGARAHCQHAPLQRLHSGSGALCVGLMCGCALRSKGGRAAALCAVHVQRCPCTRTVHRCLRAAREARVHPATPALHVRHAVHTPARTLTCSKWRWLGGGAAAPPPPGAIVVQMMVRTSCEMTISVSK